MDRRTRIVRWERCIPERDFSLARKREVLSSVAMLNDERKADLIEEKTYEKFVFGVWVKAIDDDDILAVAYNMVTAAGCACDSSNGSTWVRASGELNHLGSDPSRVILGRAGATSSSSVPPLPPLPTCAHGAVVDLIKVMRQHMCCLCEDNMSDRRTVARSGRARALDANT